MLEALENRFLPSSYTVTTTNDILHDTTPGEVTLRDVMTAIDTQAASGNAATGAATNTIKFAIGGEGTVQTIHVGSGNVAAALPALTHEAFIDGWSQGGPAYAGPPLIVLNGASAGGGANGLELDGGSSGSTVRGLVIQQFTNNGLEIKGANGNAVVGNYIGTDQTGTAVASNGIDGIRIDSGASGNTIGGTTPGSANIIVGGLNVPAGANPGTQAAVFSLGAANITGNMARLTIAVHYTDALPFEMVYVGVDVRGSSSALAPVNPVTHKPDFSAFNFTPSSILGPNWGPVGNAFPGEFLYHTPLSTGGQTSGLLPNATYVVGTLTYDLSKFGITPTPGLTIAINGTDTVIGAEVPAKPATFTFVAPTFASDQQPLVPGTATAGIAVSGSGTNSNTLQGNLIGTTGSGAATLGSLTDGIVINAGAANNAVGGVTAGAGNVVAGNNIGIDISDTGTTGNLVQGNHVGTDAHAVVNLANNLAGVVFENGATSNFVGGTTTGSGNTIAFNGKGVVVGNAPTDIATVHDSILGNTLFGNTGPAIAFGNQGATPNGVNPRPLPNDGQNTPLITALTLTSVAGSLTSIPATPFRIEVFATPVTGSANQSQVFLGFVNITTNSLGNASFTLPVTTLPLGKVVTATATNLANGDTSESSPAGKQLLVTTKPTIASSSGTQGVTFSAQLLTNTGPVNSGRIQFTVLGLPGAITTTTNANGVATAMFTLPPGVTPGQYTIVATLLEDGVATTTATSLLTIAPPVLPPVGKIGRRWSR